MSVQLIPNSDAGPNTMVPSASGAHYLMIDDDPNDGDATFLQVVSMEPPAVKVGLRIAGTPYYGADLVLSGYLVQEDAFPVDPSDGQPWSITKLQAVNPIINADGVLVEAYGWTVSGIGVEDSISVLTLRSAVRRRDFGGGVFIRVSELIGLVTVLTSPERPTGNPSAVAASAMASPLVTSATVAGLTPAASAAPLARSGTAAAIGRSSSLASVSASAAADDVGPAAFPAPLVPLATVAPFISSATPSSLAPEADPVAVAPSIEVE